MKKLSFLPFLLLMLSCAKEPEPFFTPPSPLEGTVKYRGSLGHWVDGKLTMTDPAYNFNSSVTLTFEPVEGNKFRLKEGVKFGLASDVAIMEADSSFIFPEMTRDSVTESGTGKFSRRFTTLSIEMYIKDPHPKTGIMHSRKIAGKLVVVK